MSIWSKSCGLSGHINTREITKELHSNEAVRKSYFGGKHEGYEFLDVVPTADGRGTTAKCNYLNLKKEQKMWQLGNAIWRGNGPAEPVENLYNRFAFTVLKSLSPFVVFAKVPTCRVKHEELLPEEFDALGMEDIKLATNIIQEGKYSCPSWHQDSVVQGACMVSAENMNSDTPLKSCDVGATAGQLAHELGGLLHPYGSRDVLIFCGNQLHGPMSVRKKGNEKKKTARRASYVHYICKDLDTKPKAKNDCTTTPLKRTITAVNPPPAEMGKGKRKRQKTRRYIEGY